MPQVIPLVVTAITTVTSAVVAAGPLAVAAFNAVNIVGAAALANEAFKALQPEVRQSGASIEWEANPNAALPFAFGRVGVSGNIVANRVYGPDDMYVGFVSVVSAAGPIKSFVSFKADDTPVSFDGSGKAVTSYHANVMWRRTQLGQQPEPSALSSPTGLKNGASMPGWGAAYKLSGKAAYIWTLSENSKRSAYEGRVPTPLNVIEGLYYWDPRLDDTHPGGSGPCRLNDPSTWVWGENPALFALKWALGLWEGPVGKGAPQMGFQVGGIGAKVENIRVDRFVELANISDANGWKSAAWPKADEPKDQVLDSFLQAAGAVYADEQGKISCIQRAAPRPSILTITSDDIAGTVEYDTTTSKIGRLNTIRPRFWSAANDWQMAPTDEVSATLWREEDGQGQAVTRSKGIDFNYVPGSKQARELACLLVAHTREGIRGTVPVRSYVDVEPGDAFDFQVPEATLNGLKCLVLNAEPDFESDTVLITFASESDGKYAYAYGQADAPPPAPVLEPSDPTYVGPPLAGEWTLDPAIFTDNGNAVLALVFTGEVGNATADAVIFEFRPAGAGADWAGAGLEGPSVVRKEITGLTYGTSYEGAVSYRRGSNVSERLLLGPVTVGGPAIPTPTITASEVVFTGGVPRIRVRLAKPADPELSVVLRWREGAIGFLSWVYEFPAPLIATMDPWQVSTSSLPLNADVWVEVGFVGPLGGLPETWASLAHPTTPQAARRPNGRNVTYHLSSTETTISVLAFDAYMEDGTTLSLPAGTITGLTGSTSYAVFWRAGTGYQAEVSPAPIRMTTGGWIYVGSQATSDALGNYPTRPPAPGGWGGDQQQQLP